VLYGPVSKLYVLLTLLPSRLRQGIIYLDHYIATHEAVFRSGPTAIKFAKNSAFHYLNAGRYLMAQILLHALRILAPPAGVDMLTS